jgi:RNA polymerase sigma-70 factor, ECF subfamily
MSSAFAPGTPYLEQFVGCQRSLYGYIFSLVRSQEAADEILQETNLVICQKIHQFDGKVKFITWACEIAHYNILAMQKKSHNRDALLESPLVEEIARQARLLAAQGDVRLPMLRECMELLAPPQRQLIEDRYSRGGTVEVLAKARGRSPGGIRVALHRIRSLLLDCIKRKMALEEAGHERS